MASYRKRGASWQVQVERRGVRQSATFATKGEAMAWAAEVESGILSGAKGAVARKTFGELMTRYRDEVSVSKRGERWERVRIDRLLVDDEDLCRRRLADLTASDFAAWRDQRLRTVSAATVRRDWTLLSHACTVAMREWHWLTEHPMTGIRKPSPPPPRDRIFSDDEIVRLLLALGYATDQPPLTVTSRVGAALLFAVETAMRAGEIVGLSWSMLAGKVAQLPVTKNGHPRQVPLSGEALRILDQLRPVTADLACFGIASTQSLDALFRKAKARAGLADADLHFHDSRATAITRLAKRLDILSLARMVGHRDLRMLQVYYRETAAEIAERL